MGGVDDDFEYGDAPETTTSAPQTQPYVLLYSSSQTLYTYSTRYCVHYRRGGRNDCNDRQQHVEEDMELIEDIATEEDEDWRTPELVIETK